MYRVLIGKLKEKDMTYKDLSDFIGCSEQSVKNKINGKTDFTISEATKTRDHVAPNMTIDELFKVEK